MTFSDMGLSPETLRAIDEVGYVTPTPIQEQAIPWILQGRDVLGIAQTGTGKTASFTLPMIEILANGRAKARMPRSLILAPTRELANQVSENFTLYGKYHRLSMALLIGGESFTEQEKALDRGVDVLIATPGRLLDLFDRGRIILRDVKVLVIDEADRMLDMGFIPDVEKIVSKLPPLRQTLFFSATMDNQIKRLADAFLQNPKEIRVASRSDTAVTVTQHLVTVALLDKREALRHIIRMEDVKNAFIFCNRKRDVGVLHRSLEKHGFDVCQFHGDMPQSERQATLNAFKAGSVRLMVCSDVAARGIDIADVSHVFNFDVPIHAEDYVHRIGRTGRAGKEGKAFTIASSQDGKHLAAIEKLLGKAIPPITLEGMVSNQQDHEEAEGSRKGSRDDSRGSGGRGRVRGRDRSSSQPTPVVAMTEDSPPHPENETVSEMTSPMSTSSVPSPIAPTSTVENPAAAHSPAAAEAMPHMGVSDSVPSDSRPQPVTTAYERPRHDSKSRDDRPREDRNREDRNREDRNREDRTREDRFGRGKSRRDHPARDVDAMNYGDDVLAFGGYTPAFMLVETTQYTGTLADLPEGYEDEENVGVVNDDTVSLMSAALDEALSGTTPEATPETMLEAATSANPEARKPRRSRRRRPTEREGGKDGVTDGALSPESEDLSLDPSQDPSHADGGNAAVDGTDTVIAVMAEVAPSALVDITIGEDIPVIVEAAKTIEAASPRRRAPRKKAVVADDAASSDTPASDKPAPRRRAPRKKAVTESDSVIAESEVAPPPALLV